MRQRTWDLQPINIQVSLAVSPTEAQPGDPVAVRVSADAGSDIHLLGVDQSVLLLASGNDITTEMVWEAKFVTTSSLLASFPAFYCVSVSLSPVYLSHCGL